VRYIFIKFPFRPGAYKYNYNKLEYIGIYAYYFTFIPQTLMFSGGRAVERGIALTLIAWSLAVILMVLRYQVLLNSVEEVHLHSIEDYLAKEVVYKGNFVYDEVRKLFEMGSIDPLELLTELYKDPLEVNVRPTEFKCPLSLEGRLDYPDLVNHTRATAFRQGDPTSWIFYQHLRKAGGTGFCDLAKQNLPSKAVPPYYCMPDGRGSLGTPPWNNETFILHKMHRGEYKVAANEWDVFYEYMLKWEGAVFVTTFRHPVEVR
jgi:hypothetical protein